MLSWISPSEQKDLAVALSRRTISQELQGARAISSAAIKAFCAPKFPQGVESGQCPPLASLPVACGETGLSDHGAALLQVLHANEPADRHRDKESRQEGVPHQQARFLELWPEGKAKKNPEHDVCKHRSSFAARCSRFEFSFEGGDLARFLMTAMGRKRSLTGL